MKITANNQGLKIVVDINVPQKNGLPLVQEELSRLRVELGDAVISAISKLPYVSMSVARGDIKVGRQK